MRIVTSPQVHRGSAVLAFVVGFVTVATSNVRLSSRPVTQARQTTGIRQLEPRAPVDRDLRPQQSHAYQLTLEAGQFARIIIEQRGIDVVVALSTPDGHIAVTVDRMTGTHGREQLVWMADRGGRYRLDVTSARADAPAGRYQIQLADSRPREPEDDDRLAAQAAFAEAVRIRRENNRAGFLAALQKLEEARTHSREAADREAEAAALLKIAETRSMLGDLASAAEPGEQAVTLFEAAGDRFAEGVTLLRVGETRRFLGDPRTGLQYYQRALGLMRESGDSEGEGEALGDIGEAYFILHDLERALEFDYQALPLLRASGRKEDLATVLSNIAVVFRNQGEIERALDRYKEALPLAMGAKETALQATILSNIGVANLNLDQPARALESFEEALRLRRTLGNKRGEALSLGQVGAAYERLGQYAPALDNLNQAVSLLEAIGDRYKAAVVLGNIAAANYELGNRDLALEYHTRALRVFEATGDPSEQANSLRNIAAVKRDLGRLADARADIEQAIQLSEFVRAHAGNEEQRASYVAMTIAYYDLYVDLLMQMHAASPQAGHDLEAFRVSEQARARSLLDLLSESYGDIRQGVDPELLARERDLGGRLGAEMDKLTTLLSATRVDQPRAAAQQKVVASLEDEYRRVQAEIRDKSPRFAALTQPEPVGAPDVQQHVLDRDTMLLEFRLGAPHSYVWAITTDRVSSYQLPPRAEIEPHARRVYELLTARQHQPGLTPAQQRTRETNADAALIAEAGALSRMLLDPVAAGWGTKRLVIVADGALQFLPFAILPAPGANESTALAVRPNERLIDTHEIVNVPSASVLALMRHEVGDRPPAAKAAAVLADPVFDPLDARVARALTSRARGSASDRVAAVTAAGSPHASPLDRAVRSVGSPGGSLRRLLFSGDEADAVVAAVSEPLVLKAVGFRANRALALSGELAQYRILHFATHGLLDSRHPSLSGLVLSLVDESGRPQDGFLRLHEIYNLKLNADLVVLSACQTALGREVRGEGLIGLTRGFMYAGARRVVASLWQVDDAATAELMRRFYRGMMQEKMSPSGALRAAQLELSAQHARQAPYYWGAFVLQGDWR